MSPSFKFLANIVPAILFGITYIATPVLGRAIGVTTRDVVDMSERSANTCADPSLARTVFEGFAATGTVHLLNFREAFVDGATRLSNNGASWYSMLGPAFEAWKTQQPFTSPLFSLSGASGFLFIVGANAQTPPIVDGFQSNGVIAWVYNTQICGSVPLMSASFADKADHYYTTDSNEHAALLDDGWADDGVVAFVLPLP